MSLHPKRLYQRKIVSRTHHKGMSRGGYWMVKLECGHEAKLHSDRGKMAIGTHCEKCALGLVRA